METLNYLKTPLIEHAKNLYPICRSLTGSGIRETLNYFEKYHSEYKRCKFPSKKKVFDWEIPLEWNIDDAYIQHLESGKKYAEFKNSNLHILNYSEPIDMIIDLKDLLPKIYSLENQPNDIPYVTSYYKKNWGFCLEDKVKKKLPQGKYHVYIKSKLEKGYLDLSHALLEGESKKEIFFSSYVCHPSMVNNELSGPVVLNALMSYLKEKYKKRKYTYRFILIPETIGSIVYLSENLKTLKENMICGFNLSCVGDERTYSYIKTPFGDTLTDKALNSALIKKDNLKIYSFLDRGSDERQYCSPFIRLPVCTFCRTKFGEFKEYHTSADNFNLVTEKGLQESFQVMRNIIDAFENGLYPKTTTMCEPQLGKRGLYPNIKQKGIFNQLNLRMNLLTFSDGETSIFDICNNLNVNLEVVLEELLLLKSKELIR